MEETQNKSVWLSGEVCHASGVYFADICGHSTRKEYKANDVFARCPTCHQAVRWMRLNQNAAQPFRYDGPFVFRPKLA